jgi:membrane-associated phospholipid phosphatase
VATQRRATPASAVVLVAIPVGVGLSLVAHHVHYLTDTVAGYCVAVATLLAVALGIDYWCAARRWGRRPGRMVGEHGH